jgi:sterol desaturase/sphingolipid hydroxylase (fatty acid hydroxylase superfamily)
LALQFVVSGFPLFSGGMAALATYYGIYESLPWCMHPPGGRRIERTGVFQYVDARHRLHHGLWRTNFSVVLPIGDVVFGTLCSSIPRSDPPDTSE